MAAEAVVIGVHLLPRRRREPFGARHAQLPAPPAARVRPLGRIVHYIAITAFGVVAIVASVTARDALRQSLHTTSPDVRFISVYDLYVDSTPVSLTISAGWEKVPLVVSSDRVRSDVTLWRSMRLEDWDTVPLPLRADALDAMVGRYGPLLAAPDVWDRLTADDWDEVPHAIRVLAYRHMAAYWRGYYGVGDEQGIPRQLMVDTLSAIVMSESWFEHRAINATLWGNRDLGLAQASDGARARMEALFAAGEVDFSLVDEQYFNPWHGTRFVAVWMKRLLDDVGGDLDAAVRAYHRGTARAVRGEGNDYLAAVARRRNFLRDRGHAGAWGFLQQRDRAILAAAWPWLASSAGRPAAGHIWRPRLVARPALYMLGLPLLPGAGT
jgi:hypothetical protein